MSAAAEIQAAIEKLQSLRDHAEDGPWMFLECDAGSERGDLLMGDSHDPVDAYPVISNDIHSADAALVATLHRTIDTQLGILDFARTLVPLKGKTRTEWASITLALALARAINGTEPDHEVLR